MTNEITVLNLVQGICHRPKMYTRNGTAEEVLLVLMGIHLARSDKEHVVNATNKLAEYSDGFLSPVKILSRIKEEGHTTNEDVLNRILELVDV